MTEKRGRKPGQTGQRRSVVVKDENGNVLTLATFCEKKGLALSTVQNRLRKRFQENDVEAVILEANDEVFNEARSMNSALKVYSMKDGNVYCSSYIEAVKHNAELIISKHGWKVSDSEDWQAFKEYQQEAPEVSDELEVK